MRYAFGAVGLAAVVSLAACSGGTSIGGNSGGNAGASSAASASPYGFTTAKQDAGATITVEVRLPTGTQVTVTCGCGRAPACHHCALRGRPDRPGSGFRFVPGFGAAPASARLRRDSGAAPTQGGTSLTSINGVSPTTSGRWAPTPTLTARPSRA